VLSIAVQHSVDERQFMEEALTAIRRVITEDEASETTLGSPNSSREQADATLALEPRLLSHEAIAAVGSAFSSLTETVQKHDPPLEEVVREALRPVLKLWLEDNLPNIVERMVRAEIEQAIRGR
jgi:uncharacterized protein